MTEKEQNDLKKEYLNSYKRIYKKWEALIEQEEEIRLGMAGINANQMNGMPKPKGSKKSDISDEIVRIEAILEEIEMIKTEMLKRQRMIMSSIIGVEDGVQSRILWLRYIKFKEWTDICEEIGYSWNQTHRLHSKALKNMEILNVGQTGA